MSLKDDFKDTIFIAMGLTGIIVGIGAGFAIAVWFFRFMNPGLG